MSRVRRIAASVVALALLAAAIVVLPAAVPAAQASSGSGTPVINLVRTVSPQTLLGNAVAVTLTASNSTSTDGYNLSYTDVLPNGIPVSNVSPAPTSSVALGGTNGTLLIWSNQSDLLHGTTASISYSYTYPTSHSASPYFDAGAVLTGTANAYVNSNERQIPQFSPSTGAVSNQTGSSGAATSSTTLVPFTVTKTEPSPESELLRGVHDHKTVYTITITNNTIQSTSNYSLTDYLPAGLEFLGCTNADNSQTVTQEYAGSGPITNGTFPSLSNCTPSGSTLTTTTIDTSVTPVTLPAASDGTSGALPSGIYTVATWMGLGTLAPSGTLTLQYAAAIPMRQNVMPTTAQTTAGFNSTANLDNNTGALTTDEQSLTNWVDAGGTFEGNPAHVSAYHTVSAEDVAIQKTYGSGQGTISQGATTNWTLHLESSEYATQTDAITVTDTLPDGLDYAATQSSVALSSGPTDNSDGTETVAWTLPGFSAKNGDTSILFTTTTRTTYRNGGGYVAAGDTWTNAVHADAANVVVRNNPDDGTSSTTTVAHVIDDSQAKQTSTTLSITKQVATAPSAPTNTDCSTDTGLVWTNNATGYHVGDTVCWLLTVPYLPHLTTLSSTISDFLPAGYSYVSSAATSANTASFTGPPSSSDITWTLNTVQAASPTPLEFQVILTSVITDPSAITNGQITQNLAKLRWQNSGATAFQSRAMANATVTKPILGITKSASPTTATSGSTVNFTVTVSNSGGQDAVGAQVQDVLPTGWGCANISTGGISNSGTCDSGTNTITWTGLSVAASGSTALTYAGTAPADPTPVAAGDSYVNTASVVSYQGATNTGGTVTYTPGTAGTPTATATATVSVANPTVVKQVALGTTGSLTYGSTAYAQIGDSVTFKITATIPGGTALYSSPTLTDQVGAQWTVLGESATLATTDSMGTTATNPVYSIVAGTPNGSGTAITATLTNGTLDNSTTTTAATAVMLITARLTNTAGTVRSNGLTNTGVLHWVRHSDATTRTVTSSAVTTRVTEPDIALTKTDNVSHTATPGAAVTYTLTVVDGKTGDTNVGSGYNTVVVDNVPVGVNPVSGGVALTADGAVDGTGGTGTWSQSSRTITWNVGTIAASGSRGPGAATTLTYNTVIDSPLVANSSLKNTATAVTDSQPGPSDPDNRIGSVGSAGPTGYYATTTDTLNNPLVVVGKTGPTNATIGDSVPYTLTVTVPANTQAYDSYLVDTLPTQVAFDPTVTVTASCLQGGVSCSPAITTSVIGSPDSSATKLGLWFGTIDTSSLSSPRIITITYNGIVRLPTAPQSYRGVAMTNTAIFYSDTTQNNTPQPTSIPTSQAGMTVSNTATKTVTEVEPLLTIAKAVTAGTVSYAATPPRAKPGATLTYTVTIKNTGTSTAYEAVVSDLLPKDITCSMVTPTDTSDSYSCVSTGSSTSGGTISWSLASVAVTGGGAGVVKTYTVAVPADSGLTQSLETNTADIPTYYAEPSSTRGSTTGRYLTYNSTSGYDPSSAASVTLDRGSLAGTFSLDVDASGGFNTGDVDIQGVKVIAKVLGSGGVPTGESYETTTDSSGAYLFTDIPTGNWQITVASDDTTISALGVTPSWDADGATLGTITTTLTDAQQKTGQDFGYKGTGSIGDTVWLDQNADGTKNTSAGDTEPGVPGTTVTLVRTAGGGLPAITLSTTTNSLGVYGFAHLPPGSYTVTETTPTGYSTEWDPDTHFTSPDGVTTHTLTVGQNDLAEDFGLVGTHAFSGTVWLDRNTNGSIDSGEPGIPGVTMTLTLTGGGVITTTTDASGDYSFAHLPPGSYTVAATAGLPSGAVQTFDYDGIGGSMPANQAVVNLADGTPDPTIVNFGYNAPQNLGGTVFWNFDGANTAAGHPGIPGATVTVLYFGANGVIGGGDDITYVTTANANGVWTLPNVSQGNYRVTVSGTPAGFAGNWDTDSPNADGYGVTLLTVGATPPPAQDFGYAGTGSIGTTVYLDRNVDGIKATTGEPGISPVSVTLTYSNPLDPTGASDLVLHTTTSSTGAYSFVGLPANNSSYAVAIVVPTGYTAVSSLSGTATGVSHSTASLVLTTAVPNRTDVNFGLLGSGELGDTVYLDQNGDGTQQITEPGIPGVTVTLTWYGQDGVAGTADDVAYAGTTTTATGMWDSTGLPPGTYSVVVTGVPAGLTNTGDPDGGMSSRAVVMIGGSHPLVDLAQDFGYQGTASVGTVVWLDANGDGARGSGDPGLAGVPVMLTSAGADGILGTADDISVTTQTDSTGHYSLAGLPAGPTTVSYGISALPAGDVPHSDVDGGNPATSTFTLTAGEARSDVDFVVIGTSNLAGTVFNDRNGDGVREAGEDGVAGVSVVVTWSGPGGPVSTTVISGADGGWTLSGVPAGHYTVTPDPATYPSGYRVTVGEVAGLMIVAGTGATAMTGITTASVVTAAALAVTGTDAAGALAAALLFLLGGLGMLVVARRRRASQAV